MNASYPILIAEDNPISRKMLEKNLVKEGFEVTSVANGKDALTLFRKRVSQRKTTTGNQAFYSLQAFHLFNSMRYRSFQIG